jgi:hypothetical protein
MCSPTRVRDRKVRFSVLIRRENGKKSIRKLANTKIPGAALAFPLLAIHFLLTLLSLKLSSVIEAFESTKFQQIFSVMM